MLRVAFVLPLLPLLVGIGLCAKEGQYYTGRSLDAAAAAGTLIDVSLLKRATAAELSGVPIYLNWTFQFYSSRYQHVYLSESGYVTFGAPGTVEELECNLGKLGSVPVISVLGTLLFGDTDNTTATASDSSSLGRGVYYGTIEDCINASAGGLAGLLPSEDPICFAARFYNLLDSDGAEVDAQLVIIPLGYIVLTVAKPPSISQTVGFTDQVPGHPIFPDSNLTCTPNVSVMYFDSSLYWTRLAGARKVTAIGLFAAQPVFVALVLPPMVLLFKQLLKLKMGRRVRNIAAFEQLQREVDASKSARSRSAMSSSDGGRSLSISEGHPEDPAPASAPTPPQTTTAATGATETQH